MASPLKSGKQTVQLGQGSAVRVSRIRRDPPPKVREVSAADVRDDEVTAAVVGIVTFALALIVVLWAISSHWGWTPSDYKLKF